MSISNFDALKTRFYEVNALGTATALMDWDQQCYMPSGATEGRSAQVGILSRLAHELFTADEVGEAIERLQPTFDADSVEGAMLRVAKRDFDLRTKFPAAFVERKSRLSSEAHEAWVQARKSNNFAKFCPTLAEMFEIAKEEAEYVGYKDHVYDGLLDQYEEGATAADCTAMFETLKQPTVELVRFITESGKPADDSRLIGKWDRNAQSEFTEGIAKELGYDFDRGRQDIAPHPFCTTFGTGDVRITTRYEDHLTSCLYSTMHETGHALYEQGSPMEWDRTPLQGGVSLGIHESQSRLWENIVGRSQAFVGWMRPRLGQYFPTLADMSETDLYRAINKVSPSFIRVEADEVTYNLHVMTRFELECELLTGKLAVKDLPEAWNAKYTEYLGITPTSDAVGCLQDVHWSMGSIGYFPTYTMGNLLSYQFWTKLQEDLGDTDALISRGEFGPIHAWLKEKIYQHGRRFSPKDLVKQVTGTTINADAYVAGLGAKYRAIYS